MADAEAGGLTLDELVAAIGALTPEERRRLVRRLRAGGLWVQEEALTDRQPLRVAPALGLQARRAVRRTFAAQQPAGRAETTPPARASWVTPKSEPYRSAVSGKMVMGAPDKQAPLEPHAMAPLPGQAPEGAIVVIFDGGSRGNPGQGYGSYALRWPGQPQQIVQLRFGDRVTNNEAEYDTLIAALEAILKRLADAGAPATTARVEIRGDSLLVINQVKGQWEVKEPRLQVRCERVRTLLAQVGQWQLIHHDRSQSVQTLGH
jgi:ribonuclease HI